MTAHARGWSIFHELFNVNVHVLYTIGSRSLALTFVNITYVVCSVDMPRIVFRNFRHGCAGYWMRMTVTLQWFACNLHLWVSVSTV